jgi:hypothetical protein
MEAHMSVVQVGSRPQRSGSRFVLRSLDIVLAIGIGLGTITIAAVIVDRPALDLVGSTDPHVEAELAFPVDFGDRLTTFEDDGGTIRDRATSQRPVELGAPVIARFTFTDPTTDQRVIWTIWHLVGPGVIVAGLVIARSIVRSAAHGDPFTRANVQRLWKLAALVTFGGLAHSLISGTAATLLIQRSAAADLAPVRFTVGFLPLLLGLTIAALAAVWQQGVALREDADGVI